MVTVTDLTAKVDGHLDYISQLAKQLGLNDPVETYLTPLVGKWSDLHDEAARWRTAATAAENTRVRVFCGIAGLGCVYHCILQHSAFYSNRCVSDGCRFI